MPKKGSEMAAEANRIVRYGPRAMSDFAEIFDHTALHWGETRAHNYVSFLHDTALAVASGEITSRSIREAGSARAVYARLPKAAYGHYIIF